MAAYLCVIVKPQILHYSQYHETFTLYSVSLEAWGFFFFFCISVGLLNGVIFSLSNRKAKAWYRQFVILFRCVDLMYIFGLLQLIQY